MYGFETIECPNCTEPILVHQDWKPVEYVTRAPDRHNPPSMFVIAADRLLHACPIIGPDLIA